MLKKLLLLLYILAFSVSIFGCSVAPSVDAETGEFQVGYAIRDMMPNADLDQDGAIDPIPLGGYGNTIHRLADYSLSEEWDTLRTTCVAMTDAENNTVLMISFDLLYTYEPLTEGIRITLNNKTGVPKDHIFINASHTHSGPDISVNTAVTRAFMRVIHEKTVEAALEAMEDRVPVTGMYVGDTETDRMNFVRHIEQVEKDGDVAYCGDNFGTWLPLSTLEKRGFAEEVDQTMHVLQFTRAGKPDVVMVNWRAHPTLKGGITNPHMTSDYVGTFRMAMEDRGYCFAFYQGGAGNVNSYNNIGAEHRLGTKKQQQDGYVQYGAYLADHAEDAMENAKQVETGLIKTRQVQLAGQINHSTDYLYDIAVQVRDYFNQHPDEPDVRTKATDIGRAYGIRSVYHASAIITRTGLRDTTDLELDAVTIGHSFAMTMAPNELFCGNTQWLEDQVAEQGLYEMTFTLGYSNDALSYIPTQKAYDYTCYESDITRFVPGTGEVLQQTLLEMLQQLH